MIVKSLLGICLLGISLAPPPLSPRVNHLLLKLNLNEYNGLMTLEEIDLPVLAQLGEEQLSRMGVRTMGQRIRILNAARDALADEQTVIENQTDELTATSSEEGQEEEGLMDNDVEMEGEETGDMEEEEEGGEEEEGEGGEDEEDNGDNGVIIMIIICIILTILNASK